MITNKMRFGVVACLAFLLLGIGTSAWAQSTPIARVNSFKWEILKSNPPQLKVTAKGQTSSLGWTDIKLVLRPNERPGVIAFDFVGTPPNDPSGSQIEDVKGVGIARDPGPFVEICVYARTNTICEQIITAALSEEPGDDIGGDAALAGVEFNFEEPTTTCGLMAYTKATIRPGFIKDTWFLVVSGTKTWSNIQVSLNPMIYVRKPEYWEIEVVGCISGVGVPTEEPYIVTIPLEGITGHKGIEVVGAMKREKFIVPPTP